MTIIDQMRDNLEVNPDIDTTGLIVTICHKWVGRMGRPRRSGWYFTGRCFGSAYLPGLLDAADRYHLESEQ